MQGLKAGAPIRMGGIDIGHVESVGYGKDPADSTVYVSLDIVESEAGRIRTDSKVRIVNKGLLGDKMIEITKGQAVEMKVSSGTAASGGVYQYEGAIPCRTSGLHGYSIRVIPSHADMSTPFEARLITWAS